MPKVRVKNTASRREVYSYGTGKTLNLKSGQLAEDVELPAEAIEELQGRAENAGPRYRGIIVLDSYTPRGVSTMTAPEEAAALEQATQDAAQRHKAQRAAKPKPKPAQAAAPTK